MKKPRGFIMAVLVLAASALPSYAQDRELLGDLQEIVDRQKLVVAVLANDIPPMVVTKEDGELDGFDPRLARDLAKRLKVQVEFLRTAETFGEVIDQVARGEADVGISNLARNYLRAQRVYFTTPYIRMSLTLLINRVNGMQYNRRCPTFRETLSLLQVPGKIGLLYDSHLQEMANAVLTDIGFKEFGSFGDLVAAAEQGEILGALLGEVAAKHHIQQNPGAAIRLRVCDIEKDVGQVAIAVRPDAPDLLRWLNVYLETWLVGLSVESLLASGGRWVFEGAEIRQAE